jgi:radical SAM superfamily enzyme YgiQ (UPF0313 family)
MKVLLVATNRERSPYPVAPLGALCVAAAVRATGHDVKFLDMGLARSPEAELQQALDRGGFQAVAFSIRNLDNCWLFAPRLYFDDVRRLAEIVRRSYKGPLILGGTGFSVSPQGWMQRLDADCGVIGEGERAFPEILARLESGRSLEGIDGVITAPKHQTSAAVVLPTKTVEQMSELPAPAHDLCGYARYVKRGGFVSVQTKRGCPFKCIYCIYPQLEGKRYRLRSPEAVAQEVEDVTVRSKVRHFFFVDSVFNDPHGHALAICAALRRRKLPVRWSAFCNPTGFDAELARAMKAAGCEAVEFGQDAASAKMLAALHKPFDQEDTRVALQAAHDAGLPFAIYLLFGGPGETWADVEETQNFLSKCAPAHAVFATYGIRVYEGTPMAQIARQEGQIKPDQDLFEPAYYLSPALAGQTTEKLDRIARRCSAWTSPADWRKRSVQWGQKLAMILNVRPQWKHIRFYGKYGR